MRKDKLHAMHDWKFEDDTGLENVIAYTSSSGIPARAGSVAGKATDVNLYQIGTDGTLTDIFFPSFIAYSLLFLLETATLYLYWYGWDAMQGNKKGFHIFLGLLLLEIHTSPASV